MNDQNAAGSKKVFDGASENLQGVPEEARRMDDGAAWLRPDLAPVAKIHTLLDGNVTDQSGATGHATDTRETGTTDATARRYPADKAEILAPERLVQERERVFRFCLRFTGGNAELAEDLTQETLIEALRSRAQIRDPEAWRAWLAGIARNVCLRWARRRASEQGRVIRLPDIASGDFDGGASLNGDMPGNNALSSIVLVAADDLDAALEHEEIARLLDRAMSQIPARMREILVEHYVDDLPQAEIAARRGIREETIAVQMHRGRKALRDALISPDLRRAAAELGLIADASIPWQETHIWCPECGRRRMLGKFNAGEDRTGEVHEFVLRCPDCNAGEDAAPFTILRLDDNARFAEALRGVKGFKPALNRITNLWLRYSKLGLERGQAPCLLCGRAVPVELSVPPDLSGGDASPAFFLRCRHCETLCYADVSMLSLWQPEAQQFWRGHPRIRVLPGRPIQAAGGAPAVLTRIESVTTSEVLDIITSRDTLEIIEIANGSL